MKHSILIVDDEKLLLHSLDKALSHEGYLTMTAVCGEEALAMFREHGPDVILLDVKLPDMDGMQVLQKIRALDGDVPVIIMTAFSGIKGAVEAVKLGAYDYIAKPFDIEELMFALARCLASRKAVAEVNKIRSTSKEQYSFDNIVTAHPKIRRLIDLSRRLAKNGQSTVLIMGESGTGKELFANAIHYNGPRCEDPLVTVNCASLSEGLLESELFGHEKGAFTGAMRQKRGMFELADRGTLFLDEIGEITQKTQVKLLRFLEEKKIQRVGGTKKLKLDVRIIAATNKDLFREVEKGTFREDLYYRLNVISLLIPPLRERISDLPLLIKHFIDSYNRGLNKSVSGCDRETLAILSDYSWPGNIRELRNIVERGMLLCEGEWIRTTDIPLEHIASRKISAPAKSSPRDNRAPDPIVKTRAEGAPPHFQGNRSHRTAPVPVALDSAIKTYVEAVFSHYQGNQSRTALALKITRQRLKRILNSRVD
ncbi:MAG: sigma-54-dependent Fis family transcriptional regulator [Syntrophaceae bacterium]|nr:sigma-54-dependent Fis family transcriptional regulator [Syntrophaceae bacterium]